MWHAAYWDIKCKWELLSRVRRFATPWTIKSMGFSRPEHCSGQPFPPPGDPPDPGIQPWSPHCRQILYQLSRRGALLRHKQTFIKIIYPQCPACRILVPPLRSKATPSALHWSTVPVSWETCMRVRKQQLEPDMEQWTGSKLGKGYVKDIHYQSAFLT